MTSPTYVDKAEIVATLRSRGLHARADWVDRELPDLVDANRNAGLLRTLDIEPGGGGALSTTRSDVEHEQARES
jgi:hypothetical protein